MKSVLLLKPSRILPVASVFLMLAAFWGLSALSTTTRIVSAASGFQDPGSGQVAFFDDYSCTGDPYLILDRGDYPDLRRRPQGGVNWNDRISCLRIGEGTHVIVYEHIFFGGAKKTFGRTANNPDGQWGFAGDWWNDRTSSVKIY